MTTALLFIVAFCVAFACGIRSGHRQNRLAAQESEFQAAAASSAFKFNAVPNLPISQHLVAPTETSPVEKAMIPIDVFVYGLSETCPSDVEVGMHRFLVVSIALFNVQTVF
jgi:hypothetical protein